MWKNTTIQKNSASIKRKDSEIEAKSRALEEKDATISAMSKQLTKAKEYLATKKQVSKHEFDRIRGMPLTFNYKQHDGYEIPVVLS